jgi:hypothetical protein
MQGLWAGHLWELVTRVINDVGKKREIIVFVVHMNAYLVNKSRQQRFW